MLIAVRLFKQELRICCCFVLGSFTIKCFYDYLISAIWTCWVLHFMFSFKNTTMSSHEKANNRKTMTSQNYEQTYLMPVVNFNSILEKTFSVLFYFFFFFGKLVFVMATSGRLMNSVVDTA